MVLLKGGKYDGRDSSWVPEKYLKTKEGRLAQGLSAEEEKPKQVPPPPPPPPPSPQSTPPDPVQSQSQSPGQDGNGGDQPPSA